MATDNFLQKVGTLIREIFEPLVQGITDEEIRKQALIALNLDPAQSGQPINISPAALDSIQAYQQSAAEDIDIEAFLSVINDLAQIVNALEGFINAARAGDSSVVVEEVVNNYINMLLLSYVRVRQPGFYITLKALKLIDEQSVRYGGFVEFFTQTGKFFEKLYGDSWALETEDHAKNLSDGILFVLGVVATALLKAEIVYGFDPDPASPSPLADSISDRTLSLLFAGKTKDADGNTVKGKLITSWTFVPKDHQGPGLLLRIKGSGSVEVPLGKNITLTVSVDAPDANIFLGEGDTQFPGSTDAGLSLKLAHKSAGEFKAIIGNPEGTHILFGKNTLEGKLSTKDYSVKAGTSDSSITIAGDDADSFINKILPSGKLKIDFKFAIGYSKNRGFFIEGGAGFLVSIPLHKELGPLNLQTLIIGFKAGYNEEAEIDLEASLAFSLTFGPLTAVVDRIGLASEVAFPVEDGNLGSAKVKFNFKPPSGIGLSVDGGGIKGGGFLSFEPDLSRYAGVMELKFGENVALKAIGLLTTKMPDGSKGFSLLIIISAEFQPIQLGFGFTLNGVGGLLGLNRTVKIDVLRQGIKNNALASVLFPTNIVENAPRIISDLRQIFPPQVDRFTFGPMAKLGWGSPTLVTIELGLIIEVPQPFRIALLGVVRTVLPEEKSKIIKLQINFLGAWEQDKSLISFDAGLFDSRLLAFPLAGDMAFRLKYGDDPNFLFTVGGFHPAFTPPPLALPALVRLSLSLLKGDNPRLTLSAYFAITSNTVQFGAKAELLARAWKFNIYGFIAFDALFQFSPFFFIIGISGGLAVRAGTSVLFGISLSLTLSGPTPWNAKGKASFKILFIKIPVSFNKTWGEERDTTLPDVEVMPLLTAALSSSGNWEAKLPARNQVLVSLRKLQSLDEEDIVAHPAGELTVKQKVVPLDITISRFGHQKPSDAKRFTIKKVYSGTFEFQKIPAEEHFAPAQFEDMDDSQKLSRKSFEKMPAGVKTSSEDNSLQSSKVLPRKIEYETIILDTRFPALRFFKFLTERFQTFFALLRGNAVAKSSLSHLKKADPVLGPGRINVSQEGYTVVSAITLQPFDDQSAFGSEAAAHDYLRVLVDSDPATAGEIQVVPNYEVQKAA